ncbi:MAG TPA: HAMP domain-containing sensor histidine kinase, partial [Streptosporangiaceae bacterium]|nr:HAMP domain-containing sensor histidine kinase [Streptosporangiaceae bacterium]
MKDTLEIVGMAAGCAAIVGVLGLLVLRLLRGRSLRAALFAIALSSVLAMAAGTVAVAHAMFISPDDVGTVIVVLVSAGIVALVMAGLLGRSVAADSKALRSALRSLGAGPANGARRPAAAGPPPKLATSEMADLSRELAATSMRLAESRERERALERSRRELVAWVSHDLRTPLAGLRAMAEALEDGVAADPARYYAQMRQAVERLTGMVGDLFELSRIHAGALRLSLQQVWLADLVDDAVAGAHPLAQARRVRLAADIHAPLAVRADAREMSRALTNLVVNAIRHTPGDGTVRVEADHHDGFAVLTVTDACGGIPEAHLERLFDVAWRGSDARTPDPYAGAGLGLAIVRGIVEAHSGEVDVRNITGGCRFEVRLPVPA